MMSVVYSFLIVCVCICLYAVCHTKMLMVKLLKENNYKATDG